MTGEEYEIKQPFFSIPHPVDDATVDEYERGQLEIMRSSKIKHSGIPSELQCYFSDYECETAEQTRFLNQMQKAFENWKKTHFVQVCAIGKNGTGKTMLACAFLMESTRYLHLVHGEKTFYSIAYRLCSELREEYENARSFTAPETQKKIIDRYCEYDLLCLDEVGMSDKGKDTEREIIYRIINARCVAKKTTILVSNLSWSDFSTFLGKATVDRLKEHCFMPDCSGIESYRGRHN